MTLIEQIEQAEGPSRELDAELAPFVGLRLIPKDHPFAALGGCLDENGHGVPLPSFTASIDAALTLVPEGMRRRVMSVEDGRAAVQLVWPGEPWPDPWGELMASEPIATVYAALKAKGIE